MIFEYQTMICELTGMDVSNASCMTVKRIQLCWQPTAPGANRYGFETVHPDARRVLSTFLNHQNVELVTVPMREGVTDLEAVKNAVSAKTAAILIQTPNFLGYMEEIAEVEKLIHQNKGLLILSVDPISLGWFKSPGEWGADIAIGEGQSLGNSMSFGGPGLGFMACTKSLMRKMPGRIVGQTKDAEGRRGFVSTLQTREQHIRREKATSNICSNQALNAGGQRLSHHGQAGLQEVARQCYDKSHYAASTITASGKYRLAYEKPFFKEFPIISTVSSERIQNTLLHKGIIGGYSLNRDYPELENGILYCVTEKRTRQEIDVLTRILEEMA